MSPRGPAPAGRTELGPDDARLAALLLALDPEGLGGIWLRARAGPARDAWLAGLRAALPGGAPVKRIPLHASDERLLGGLDLAATLAAGRPVAEMGLLAGADGGLVLLPSAERVSAGTAARVGAALDTGEVAAECDGFALRQPARIAVVALDEGIEPDERPPAALAERLAFHLDLSDQVARDQGGARPDLDAARERLPRVGDAEGSLEALCAAALAFGIASLRPPLFALRAARASAALAGRTEPGPDDLAAAARLVLAPRATRLPAGLEDAETPPDDAPAPEPKPDDDPDETSQSAQSLEDMVVEALAAAIPAGLLAQLRLAPAARGQGGGGSGQLGRDRRRGRPAGTVRGQPARGARLNLIETLRAAAPWQRLRRAGADGTRLAIRRDDLRVTRFKNRRETTTVFVVDASGSAAFGRLAEAKGAVELLLADCYVRRDRVALLAFRGAGADLLLPPTRSLARAKRSLAALPGGGGTPLAAAIDAAGDLADGIARSGGTAVLVFLTDGRANVARDGAGGREKAAAEAEAAGRRLRDGAATVLLIDTSPRGRDPAGAPAGVVATAMGARYLPLPSADSRTISGLVRQHLAAP